MDSEATKDLQATLAGPVDAEKLSFVNEDAQNIHTDEEVIEQIPISAAEESIPTDISETTDDVITVIETTPAEALPATEALRHEAVVAGERRMMALNVLYGQMEQAMRDHDNCMQNIFRIEIDSLRRQIADGIAEQHRLAQEIRDVTHHKDAELQALQDRTDKEREHTRTQHVKELEQHSRSAQQDMLRLEAAHHQQLEAQVAATRAEMAAEADHRVAATREELVLATEAQIKQTKEEMTRVSEARVAGLCKDLEKMKVDFRREREQYTRAMETEMARVSKREQEARERALRAETAQKNDEYRQPLQAWAVGRIFGVGSYARPR